MNGILADVNIEGYVDLLVAAMQAEPWKQFWEDLRVRYHHFSDVGLVPTSADNKVWEICQNKGLVLITSNRNQKGADSLETTIRVQNRSDSLPVLTVANVFHLHQSRDYAERVVEKLLDFLTRMESLRGTGRLYSP